MLYVGAYSNFNGVRESKDPVHVRMLEKLGHSRGRGERFLKEWRRQDQLSVTGTATIYRSLVLVLPEGFRLRNDVVQQFCRSYSCGWQEAKFHVYRLAAADVMGKSDDWRELLTKNETPTTEPEAPISETASPDSNVEVPKEVESL